MKDAFSLHCFELTGPKEFRLLFLQHVLLQR